ncbi:MAG: N-acetyltransferase, partial [Betaproteobacteria bacterium]|nr:N-acetyltransferase [Betaproteobacteria bacterium]
GVLSLVDLSLTHRRAEVMLGMMPNSPAGLSAAAMFVLFQFFFRIMKFNKLYSFVYDDNPRSLQGALHLGFVVEGRLRRHVVDPRTGDHLDLIQTGLLASDAFNPTTEKLMQRLLRPRALPGRSIGQ